MLSGKKNEPNNIADNPVIILLAVAGFKYILTSW